MKTHGMSHQRLHNIWCSMRQRCEKPSCSGYWKYGAKGIKVCDEWQTFETFRDWAYTHGYTDDLTIDRIDPVGNYEPGNCRWVSQKIQQNNRSNNVFITYNGETHNIEEWSEISGLPYKVIYDRNHRGWSPERIFNQKKRKSPTRKTEINKSKEESIRIYFDKLKAYELLPKINEIFSDTMFVIRSSEPFGRKDAATYEFRNGGKALFWRNATGIVIDFREKSFKTMYPDRRPEDERNH